LSEKSSGRFFSAGSGVTLRHADLPDERTRAYYACCGVAYSIALDFMHHNFCRKHMTIKTTPARVIGIEYRTWTIRDIAELLPAACHKEQF
jgi:hypothetical protein